MANQALVYERGHKPPGRSSTFMCHCILNILCDMTIGNMWFQYLISMAVVRYNDTWCVHAMAVVRYNQEFIILCSPYIILWTLGTMTHGVEIACHHLSSCHFTNCHLMIFGRWQNESMNCTRPFKVGVHVVWGMHWQFSNWMRQYWYCLGTVIM